MSYVVFKNLFEKTYGDLRHYARKRGFKKRYEARLLNNGTFTNEHKKKIREFYSPYCKVDTTYHQVYFERTGVFSEKYLPADLYFNVVDEYFNDRFATKYFENKSLFKRFFVGIRQPEYVVAKRGGIYYDNNENVIGYETVKEIIANQDELFLKAAVQSCGGKGVSYISKEKGNMVEQFEEFNNKNDLIVQKPIKQHKDMSAINESSVNTIRVISLLRKDEVKIYSIAVRAGQKGAKCDNASGGGVCIGVTEDGKLKKYGYEISGKRYEQHPTNDFVFEGHQLPSFEKVKDLVKKAHPLMPYFKLISWDICVCEDGEPILLEANLRKGSLDIHQYNNGPLFGDDTKEILDEVFGKNN